MLEMSSLEKLHTGRGSMQGHGRFSDGFSDCGGSFMDDTDREVSNLTDRAFRSLCIGEEAIYNDTEFSSPTERHKAFGEEQQQKTESSYGVGEVGAQSETASTFQHSYVDVTHQEQVFKAGSLSYTNNGSKEVTWQQGRSASRVSSLIKAFSSGECYQDRGAYDVIMAKDNFRDPGHESWDKSALLNIHRDLSEFSSGYHQNFMSGPFQTYRNHFYTSDVAAAVAQMDTAVMMKSSQSKFKALTSTNSFFHSEFSPFQLWEDYNRFPFESTKTPGFMSANEFPRWYDSPMYKELKDTHTIPNYSPCESRRFSQDVVQSQRSRSTVMQKAYAVEKRCESETASNCPPWKKSNNFVKNKLPSNRPSTVSPTNEKTCRPDSSLFGNTKVTQEFQHKVEKVVDSAQPSNVTPFNITQLLTPVIHNRQETETSEIQQTAQTPSLSDYSPQGEADPKSLSDAKLLRDSYKTKASSLLFNLKDNRKRVKSTYSPTRFKGVEVTDRNKQPSKLEGRESRFSDLLSPETAQENFIEIDPWTSKNQIQEHSIAPVTPKNHVGAVLQSDNLTLTSPQIPNGARNYNFHHGSSQGHFLSPDLLTNTESTQRELSSHNLSTQDKSSVTSEGQLKDLSSTVSPTRPEIAKTHLPAHQTSEQRFGSNQNDPKQRQDYVRQTHLEYNQKEAVKERSLWDQTGSVNSTDRETLTINGRCEAEPFRGETASQIRTDKQKAIAKQYSPSANNSFSVRKETYMQKVNEDIKLGRLAKEEDPTFRKTYGDTPVVHDNQLNTFSRATDSYGVSNYLNKASSPPKEGQAYRGLQKYTIKNDLAEMLHSERDSCASSKRKPTQKTSEQRALYAPSDENKDPNVSYQQYRYEANKQWRMTSGNEDKHIKDNAWTLEKTAEMLEHNGTKDKISSRLSSAQQNMLQKTMVSQKELHANSASQDKVSVKKISDQNTSVPSRKEDRFCINDILAIRDNEHANSIKEKNVFVGDLARSENPQNLIKNDTAEQKPNITGAIKEQEAQGYKVPDYSPAAGYLKKDLNNVDEGLANINMDRKDKLMCKNNDRVATGALTYKERGQSKQEILTSKLTAQAQKEILAIKEKGFGKRGIFARNTTKQSMSISSETAHDGQEGHTAKKEKEITADRLKHLFRDITYSSVTQHKEVKTHNDHPAYGSPPSREQQSMESQEAILTVASDKKSLATERQKFSLKHDRRPAGDEETLKEAFIRNEKVKNIKTYQPDRFTEDTQIGRIGLIDINPKEQLAATSPFEAKLNRHLTPSVKTENYTSHNPPALHSENQTMQTEKRNLQAQYKYSEQVVTEPKDIFTIKKDDKSPAKSIEDQKANSGLNQTSQKSTDEQQDILGLDRYVPKVEKSTVHHNSGLTAAVEQSKNEPIKNSCGIKVSQMTSSSNDMMVQNGNPPAKLLTQSAKSQLTAKPQTNTMNPDEKQFKNGNYMHSFGLNPGMKSTSSVETTENNTVTTNDRVSPKTKDLETLESLVKDSEAAISKNNTSSINDVKQNKISPVKAVETAPADKMLVSQSESETNKESLKQMSSDDANESLHKKENAKELRESASHTHKEDLLRPIGTACKEENPESVKESQKVTPENTISNLHKVAKDSTEVNTSIQHTVTTGEETTHKNNTDLVSMQNVDFTENDSHTEEEPAEEPMIFNIFVSSKTENPSNDEPMIFTICVSSTIYSDEQQNPVQEEDKSSPKTEICVIKVDSVEKDQDGNKSIDHRQTEVSSNINAEKETMVRNSEQPAQTSMENEDKPNECMDKHCKPTEIGNISTSNENLIAKYELPDRNHSHLNRSLESKEKSSDDISAQIHAEELRKTSDQQASLRETQLLKKNDIEIKQQANSPVKEQHCDIPSITVLSKMSEKQQITENDKLKLATCSRNDTLIPKDAKNGEQQDHDTENIEAMKQSRRTGDSQLKDKKVEEQVRNTEKVQRLRKTENTNDDVSTRKSPLKIEDVSLTAKEPAATSDSTKTATTAEVLKTSISNATVAKHTFNTKLIETTGIGQTLSHVKDKFLVQNTTTKDQKTEYAKQDDCTGTVQRHSVSAITRQSETTGTGQALSHATKKPQKVDNGDKRSDTFLVQNTITKDQKIEYAKQDDCTGTVQRHSVSAKTKQTETTGTGQTLSHATKKPQKMDSEIKNSDSFLVQNNTTKDQKIMHAKQDDCTGTVQRHSVSAKTKQTETTGTGQTLSHATKKPQKMDSEIKNSDSFLVQNNTTKDQKIMHAKQDDYTGTVQRHSVSAKTKQSETTGTGQTLSHATKKPQKVDCEDKRSDAFLVQNNTSKDQKIMHAKQDDYTGTVQRHFVSAKTKQSETTGTGQTLSHATKKPQKVDCEDKRSDAFLVHNNTSKDQKTDYAKQDYCNGTVQKYPVSAKTKQSETTGTGQTLSHATKKPQRLDNEDKSSDTFLVQNNTSKDQKTDYAKQDDGTGTVQRHSVSATTKQSETTGTGQTLSHATKKPQKADNEDKRSDAFLVQHNNSKDQIDEYAKQDDGTGTVQRHSVLATTKQSETTETGQTLSYATKKHQKMDSEDKSSDTFLVQNNNSKDQEIDYAKQDYWTGTVQRHSVSTKTKQSESTGTGQTLSYSTKKPQKVENKDKRSDAFLVQNNTSKDQIAEYAKQDDCTGTVQRHSVSATAKQSENTGTGQTLSYATKKPQKVDNEDKRSDEFLIQNTITKDQKIDSAKQDYCVGTVQRHSVSAKTKQSETTSTGQTLSHATKKPHKVDNEDKRSDTFLVQNIITKDQNIEYAKQNDCTGTVQRHSVSAKDAQVLQNLIKGDFEEKKTKPDKNQAGFNTHNEITNRMKMVSKNGASTHVNNYLGKGSIIGEDVCAVVKRDQTSFEVPNIHLKDINKVSSKQELIEDHKKKESQRETREGVVTENMGNKDFTKQRNLQVKSPIAQNIWMDNMKETGEKTPKQKDYLGKEILPPKKDSQKQTSPLLKQEAVQKQERKASDKIQKEDSGILRPSGHLNNDGNLKVNENRSSFREKKERNSETITDQHQSGRGILEPKGNVSYASQQDNKSDVIPSKPEAAQKNKKVTRPEISALADYARLRVISVENDTKETDILPKIDFYYSHDHSVRGLPQNAHGNVSFLDPVGEFKGEAHSVEREKGKNPKPLQFLQRDKETFSPQNHSNSSFFSAQPKLTDKESNTKPSFMEETNREVHHKISQSKNLHAENHLALQAEARSGHFRSRQVDHENATENVPHSVRQKSPLPLQAVSATVKTEQNPINTISPAREETEELQYYTVNALDSDVKLKETPKPPQDTSRSEPPSSLDKITHNKDGAHKSEEEINEDRSFLQSLLEYGKVQTTGPRSNSSSPAMGKPTMFKVKDNTIRTSSVTKTVKPCFHRSFSDDFSMGSPMEHLSGSEKGDEEHIQPVNSPVIHEPATASQWLSKSRETRPQNILPSAEFAAKQLKSHQRSQNLEDEDTRCVMSEDVVNVRAPYSPKIFREIHRNTYQRPASACYERPESSCYERPESACSDIRPLGKPPSVPPKTEKGLRRAQRLTTRRMKKAENKTTPENQEQLAPEPIRDISTVPSSSSLSTHLPVQAMPHVSHYSAESNFTTPMHGMVAQPFTMTQRKLLQDPNSGQFFMVDVPLAVKTKTFYDPETGKYVQLNIRPRSQSAHSHPTPVEVLNGPYMLYPGFLPVPASSLPSIRPSSQLSAPTTVTGDQLDPGTDVWKQTQQKYSINSRGQPESAYRSYEHIRDPSLNAQNNFGGSERRTDIITMSELEDFAMESA